MAGAIPFCAIGLALGYFAGPNSSVAIVNLIFMPTAFASGLWIPFEVLPPVVKSSVSVAPSVSPGAAGAQYHWLRMGAPAWTHVLSLAGFTALGLGLAWIGYRRDEDQTWG